MEENSTTFVLILSLLGSIFGGGTIAGIITALTNRQKVKQEAMNIAVNADVSVSEAWKTYAHEIKSDLETFKNQSAEKFQKLVEHKERLDKVNADQSKELHRVRNYIQRLQILLEQNNITYPEA